MTQSPKQPRGAGDWYDAIADADVNLEMAALLFAAVKFLDWRTGDRLRPSLRVWAQRARVSERTLQRRLSEARDQGLLNVAKNATPKTPGEYSISYAAILRLRRGDSVSPQGCQADAPEVTHSRPRGDSQSPQGCQAVTQSPSENTIKNTVIEHRAREAFDVFFDEYPASKRPSAMHARLFWFREGLDQHAPAIMRALREAKANPKWVTTYAPRIDRWLEGRPWEAPEAAPVDPRARREGESDVEYSFRMIELEATNAA